VIALGDLYELEKEKKLLSAANEAAEEPPCQEAEELP